ncbi:hypothetical protein SO802_019347 [Lithocarpus litseifolius]|uniref:C2H2-type domain-containing protein n=1 Tax=Lithocarpus litseifolius TaxID=425828 RepID=A0AAW2CNH6_9ROSI
MDIDLQQYSDEWFDIINVPIGKEFELPNISNTMNHQLIYTINKLPEANFENPINETELDVSCSTEIHLASTPIIGSVVNVKTKNKQVCEPNPPLQTPKGINFPMANQQPNFRTTFNSSQVCPNKSKHMTNQTVHFQGLRKPPLPCLKVGLVTKQENPNGSTHKVNQFSIMSNVGPQSSSCTNGSLTNNQFNFPLLDCKREPLVLPENNSPPLLVPKREPLVLSENHSPPMLVPKQEPQVLSEKNSHPMLVPKEPKVLPENNSPPMLVPKQEPQILLENHPPLFLVPKQEPQILPENDLPPVFVPKQEPQKFPENDPPPVLITKQEPQFFPENDPPPMLVPKHEPQVHSENDSHPMLVPKQEPQVHAENNSPPILVPKQEPEVLPENNSPPLLVPKQEPQVHPENNSPQVDMDSQNHSSLVLGSTMKPNSFKSGGPNPKKIKRKNPIAKKTNETQTKPPHPVEHKCFQCHKLFQSGNALGGHMSSHAKRRKMEAMRYISKPFGLGNSFFDFIDSLGFEDLSSPCANQFVRRYKVLHGSTSQCVKIKGY